MTHAPHSCPPACLSALETRPWGERLFLARCDYRSDLLATEHFPQAGVPLPESLASAVAKRRTEYLAGRVCAQAAMAALGHRPVQAPAVNADRSPAWPAGVAGAITHSQGRAAALVGDARHWRGVGLDAEAWLPPDRAQRLEKQILTGAEREALGGLDAHQRARRITVTFSVKESLFKALYPLTGQRFYFHDAALEDDQTVLLKTLSQAWPAGARLPFHWQEDPAHGVLSWITVAAPGGGATDL
ncbi:4'-phosphopantetheinyl transferase (plasmid) [Alcanivorax sp. N3-2A]|nr:4'-phosphopantetheinyl transferase [Alcanivorax sp. N3-2A]ASK36797.1 4'-phosphopantetheinyl transferase [Alcanivorax sp. N3-2A]